MAKWPGYKVKCSVISFGRFSGHECYGHVFLVASKGATSGERVKHKKNLPDAGGTVIKETVLSR